MFKNIMVLAIILAVFAAIPAHASHFRGAAMIPEISSTGVLTVTTTSFWRKNAISPPSIQLSGSTSGSMSQQSVSTDTTDARYDKHVAVHTRQLSGAGTYNISWSSGARVSGIKNASASSWTMNSMIVWDGVSNFKPITFDFNSVQPEVQRGSDYNESLGVIPSPGLTLSYDQALNNGISSQPPGFTVNTTTGALHIPAANTATYQDNTSNDGADYAFSGNIFARDSNNNLVGQVEFDWLFDAVDNGGGGSGSPTNSAPRVVDANTTVNSGDTVNHTFTATDDNLPTPGLTWDSFQLLGPGGATPAVAPTFDPNTQQFSWDTTGSQAGTWIAQVRTVDNGGLTDVGRFTINVNAQAIPEPSSYILFALGALLVFASRKRS